MRFQTFIFSNIKMNPSQVMENSIKAYVIIKKLSNSEPMSLYLVDWLPKTTDIY